MWGSSTCQVTMTWAGPTITRMEPATSPPPWSSSVRYHHSRTQRRTIDVLMADRLDLEADRVRVDSGRWVIALIDVVVH